MARVNLSKPRLHRDDTSAKSSFLARECEDPSTVLATNPRSDSAMLASGIVALAFLRSTFVRRDSVNTSGALPIINKGHTQPVHSII